MHPHRYDLKTGKVVSDWIALKEYIKSREKARFDDSNMSLKERSEKWTKLDDFSKGIVVAYEIIIEGMMEIETWSIPISEEAPELRRLILDKKAFDDLKGALEDFYETKLDSFVWESLEIEKENLTDDEAEVRIIEYAANNHEKTLSILDIVADLNIPAGQANRIATKLFGEPKVY